MIFNHCHSKPALRLLMTIIISLLILYFTLPVLASNSSPSAETKAQLETLKQEIASRAAKLKQEINLKLQNKAYVGSVKNKSENSITLATDNGPKIVSVNQDTIYEKLNSNSKLKFNASALTQEDYIAALGDIDDTNVLIAKKVILLPAPHKLKQTIWGTIFSISDKVITIRDKASKNISITIEQSTEFKKGDAEILQTNLRPSDTILISGFLNTNETIESTFIYVIPSAASKSKVATDSAGLTTGGSVKVSSPSATPKTSTKPKPTRS